MVIAGRMRCGGACRTARCRAAPFNWHVVQNWREFAVEPYRLGWPTRDHQPWDLCCMYAQRVPVCLVGRLDLWRPSTSRRTCFSLRSTWQRVQVSHSPQPSGVAVSCLWLRRHRVPTQCPNKNRYPLLRPNSFSRPTDQAGTPLPSHAGPGSSLSRSTFPPWTDASPPCCARATCSPKAKYASAPSNTSQSSK